MIRLLLTFINKQSPKHSSLKAPIIGYTREPPGSRSAPVRLTLPITVPLFAVTTRPRGYSVVSAATLSAKNWKDVFWHSAFPPNGKAKLPEAACKDVEDRKTRMMAPGQLQLFVRRRPFLECLVFRAL